MLSASTLDQENSFVASCHFLGLNATLPRTSPPLLHFTSTLPTCSAEPPPLLQTREARETNDDTRNLAIRQLSCNDAIMCCSLLRGRRLTAITPCAEAPCPLPAPLPLIWAAGTGKHRLPRGVGQCRTATSHSRL